MISSMGQKDPCHTAQHVRLCLHDLKSGAKRPLPQHTTLNLVRMRSSLGKKQKQKKKKNNPLSLTQHGTSSLVRMLLSLGKKTSVTDTARHVKSCSHALKLGAKRPLYQLNTSSRVCMHAVKSGSKRPLSQHNR